MKRKSIVLLSGFATTMLIVGSIYIGVNNIQNNKVDNKITVAYSTINLQDKDLVNKSDIIIKGKVVGIKDKAYRTVTSDNSTGKVLSVKMDKNMPKVNKTNAPGITPAATSSLTIPVVIYEVEITDSIKNTTNTPKIIELCRFDADSEYDKITVGEEYVLFLNKTPVGNSEFTLTSIDQGCYHLKDKNGNLEDMKLKKSNSIKYDELKTKILDVL